MPTITLDPNPPETYLQRLSDIAVANPGLPVVVMFGSNACPACNNTKPNFEAASDRTDVVFVMTLTQTNRQAFDHPSTLGSGSVPRVTMFADGQNVLSEPGSLASESEVDALVDRGLAEARRRGLMPAQQAAAQAGWQQASFAEGFEVPNVPNEREVFRSV